MRASRWQILISVALSAGVCVLAYVYRERVFEAVATLREIRLRWLALALALVLSGFFMSSQVYGRAMRSLGYRVGALRLWLMTITAIVLSQSFPAGGVASYAFLVQTFRRRGIADGHAALLASLEALSYSVAMILLFCFSLCYIVFKDGFSAAGTGTVLAGVIAIGVISTILFLVTRAQATLTSWLLAIKNRVARLLRREWSDAPIHRVVGELTRGRDLLAERRGELGLLIVVQLVALALHSSALLVVLHSLGTDVSPLVVLSAFGVALISSTFNVLPGGGGTVEAAIVLALEALGVGSTAITAAVIFRLLNYWLIVPIAFVGYRWAMHGGAAEVGTEDQEAGVSVMRHDDQVIR